MSIEVSIREPLGQRQALLPLVLGGPGADLQLPGDAVPQLRLEADGRQWLLRAVGESTVNVNGSRQRSPAPLSDHDVFRAGDAHLVVQPSLGRVEVIHLAGNATVAPVQRHVLPGEEVSGGVHEIVAAGGDAGALNATAKLPARGALWLRRGLFAALGALAIAAAWILFALVPVPVQTLPAEANISAQGWLHWHAGDRVFLMPGRRTLEISHPGYRSQQITLDVAPALADAAALPLTLELLPGVLVVDTQGEAAELLVDGRVVAQLPGEAEIAAGTRDIIVRAPQRIDHVTRIDIQGRGERQTLEVLLQSSTGWLVVDTVPAAARVSIDGEYRGDAPQRIELPAGLHNLSLSAQGRSGWSSEIAIIAGQTLDLGRVGLVSRAPLAMRPASAPPDTETAAEGGEQALSVTAPPPAARVQSALAGTMVLFPAGSYQQGSDRREQGRRSNEVLRMVTLTRPFYLAETEVSNAQFRAFRAGHVAGIALDRSLDLDSQAASNLSWNDAVEFCNWLSLREGLPVAYERRDGRWQLVQPASTGYRLPTEAEWEYAARFVDGQHWQRYAWGDSLPPPPGAANVAGQEILPSRPGFQLRRVPALPDHGDEHPVIAPVDSYSRTPAGLLHIGGNVSEWMHDVYASMPEAGPVTDPEGPQSDGPHGIRGANFRTAAIAELRLAWRERSAAPAQTIGFRVARFAVAP